MEGLFQPFLRFWDGSTSPGRLDVMYLVSTLLEILGEGMGIGKS